MLCCNLYIASILHYF